MPNRGIEPRISGLQDQCNRPLCDKGNLFAPTKRIELLTSPYQGEILPIKLCRHFEIVLGLVETTQPVTDLDSGVSRFLAMCFL